MELKAEEVSINGTVYVPKSDVQKVAECLDGMAYVIVRTYLAGVYAGYVAGREGREVLLKKARMLWYWDGAASLSQLAMEGTSKPENCKFPCEVESIELLEAVSILDCTEKARKSIQGVKVWKS